MCDNYHITKQPNPNKCSTSAIILSCFKSGWQYMYEVENLDYQVLLPLFTKDEKGKSMQIA